MLSWTVVLVKIVFKPGQSPHWEQHFFLHVQRNVGKEVTVKLGGFFPTVFDFLSSQELLNDISLASKSDALSLSINPLLLLSPNMSIKYSVWTFSEMNKELILRLMLSCTCFVQAKNCAMGNCLDRPFTIDFCLSHPTNSMFSMSLFSPFRVLTK